METTPFHAFIALIAFDQAVHALEGQLQNNEKESQQLKSQEQRLHDDLENSKRQWIEAKKGVDDKELEVKDLEQKETTKKSVLIPSPTIASINPLKQSSILSKKNNNN